MTERRYENNLRLLLEMAKAKSTKIKDGNPFTSDLQAAEIIDALVKECNILVLENEVLRRRGKKE